jgi:hypothetical protein
MTVNFKFEVDQKVKVEPLGITGIISLCGFDDGGVKYYIDTATGGDWFKEKFLTDAGGNE